MKIEILDGIGRPIVQHASRVLITMDDGTPVCAATEWQPGQIICAHAKDKNFHQLLAGLGIDRTVVVTDIVARPL